MDVIDGAASLTIADEPGPSQNMIAFPSPYACRFDVEIT
jgi:hypothetical protein